MDRYPYGSDAVQQYQLSFTTAVLSCAPPQTCVNEMYDWSRIFRWFQEAVVEQEVELNVLIELERDSDT